MKLRPRLEPCVRDARVGRREFSHFFINLRCRRVGHRITDSGGELTDDLPVSSCLPRWRYDRPRELYAALGIGVGSIALSIGRRRQHDLGKLGRFGEKNILHNQEFEILKRFYYVSDVGIGEHGIFTHDVHRFDLSFAGRGQHLCHRQSRIIGELDIPRFLEFSVGVGIGNLLVAGVVFW